MKARVAEIQTFIAHVEKAMDLYVLENGYPSSGRKYIPWDELGIDVSSYCDSVDNYGICTAKNFSAFPLLVYSDYWYSVVSPSQSAFGSSDADIYIDAYKDGTKKKICQLLEGSLKAKPVCDALKASDPSWIVELGCAG